MLLTDLLTLAIISCNFVSFVFNDTVNIYRRSTFSTKCSNRGFSNTPFAAAGKMTSFEVANTCYPFHQKLLPRQRNAVINNTNTTFANTTFLPLLSPVKRPPTKKAYINASVSSALYTKELALKIVRREEFRKLRRFHFGREVPVAGICMCVALDCALIALTCAVLNYEDLNEEDQEVEVFERFENMSGRLVREAQTQTTPTRQKTLIEKSVQTDLLHEQSTGEQRALTPHRGHQSDC